MSPGKDEIRVCGYKRIYEDNCDRNKRLSIEDTLIELDHF